jgi:hypothetical protein
MKHGLFNAKTPRRVSAMFLTTKDTKCTNLIDRKERKEPHSPGCYGIPAFYYSVINHSARLYLSQRRGGAKFLTTKYSKDTNL